MKEKIEIVIAGILMICLYVLIWQIGLEQGRDKGIMEGMDRVKAERNYIQSLLSDDDIKLILDLKKMGHKCYVTWD